MQLVWGSRWQKSQNWLRAGWLTTAGLVALYIGTIQPDQSRGIAQERGTGQTAVGWGPISLWQAPLYDRVFRAGESQVVGVVGGIPGGTRELRLQQAAGTMSSVHSIRPQAPA